MVTAALKPGKSGNLPNEYHPITLLSITYKLLEILIYNRISNVIDANIPIQKKNRGCTKQVIALTTLIENGFQNGLKSFAVFIGMTAAYDTVWVDRLLHKFADIVNSKKLISLMLNICYIIVYFK